jgi:hypothetical protein
VTALGQEKSKGNRELFNRAGKGELQYDLFLDRGGAVAVSPSMGGRVGVACQRTLSQGMVGGEKSMPFRTMGLGKSAQDMPLTKPSWV